MKVPKANSAYFKNEIGDPTKCFALCHRLFLTPQFAFVFVGCSFAATQERRVQGVWSPENFGNESFSKDRRSNRFYHSQINNQLHETNRECTHIFYACVDTLAPVLQYLTEQRVHLCFNESNFLEVRAFESKPRTSEKRN